MKRAELEQWSRRDVARLLALLESERRYYQKIVSGIPLGLAVIAEDLRVLAANEVFRSRFAADRRAVLGRALAQVLPCEGLFEFLTTAIRSRTHKAGLQCRLERPAETQLLRVSVTPLRRTGDDLIDDADDEFLLVIEAVPVSAQESRIEEAAAEGGASPAMPLSTGVLESRVQEAEIERLLERLAEAEKQLEKLQTAEIEALRAKELEAELARLQAGLEVAETSLLAASIPTPSKEMAEAQEETSRIRAELLSAQSELRRLRALEAELEEVRPTVERLRDLEREVAGLRQVKASLEAAEDELERLRPAMEAVGKLRESEAEVARLQSLAQEVEALRISEQETLNKLQSAESEIDRLKSVQDSVDRMTLTLRSVEKLRAAAQDAAQRFSDAIELLDGIVWEARADTYRTVFVSRQAETILGYPLDRWLQEAGFRINCIHPDDRARILAFYQSLAEGGSPQRAEYRAVRADSQVVWLRDDAHAVRDSESGALHLRGIITDITALKKLGSSAAQLEKMESLSRLAARLSHDFNNYLTTINGYSEFILERMGGYATFSPFLRDVEEIKKAGERAASLTRQLLLFSQKQVLEPHVLDVNLLLSNMENLLRRVMGENVALDLVLSPDSGNIKADPAYLETAILNLAVNAREAMPQGGRLTIETQPIELRQDGDVESLHAGRYVVIRTTDIGAGMSEETLQRIFEPFFTTKPQSANVGLGLSMVYGFVKQSGGEILVESHPGRGATFSLYFPASAEDAEPNGVWSSQVRAVFGNETILLTEDNESLRSLMRSVLQRKGYTVLEASRGEEALRLSERHEGDIDLLITDWMLPDTQGPQVAESIRAQRPRIGVLLVSAYVEGQMTESRLPQNAIFQPKPFTLEVLLRKIREALDARPGPLAQSN